MPDKKITKSPIKISKDRALTEEKLINAAEIIFSIHGYNGATTRMIAQEADVNVALINRYFDGKYGLLFKVIEHKNQHHSLALHQDLKADSLSELCYKYFLKRLQLLHNDTDFFRIILVQNLTDQHFAENFQNVIKDLKCHDQMTFQINLLKKQKKVNSKLNPIDCIELIMSMMFGMYIGDHLLQNIDIEIVERKIGRAHV